MKWWAVILALLLPPAVARADSNAECASAYEQGQKLRKERRLRDARRELVRCVSDDCPDVARRDCNRWLVELDASMPTVVFEVFGRDGRELDEVRIAVDGQLLVERNDGRAYPVDPGRRRFRFEVAGAPAQEKSVVVREGEKNRKILASFKRKEPAPVAPDPGPPIPAGTWALGAVSLATLSTALVLGVVGVKRENDLRSSCAATELGCAEEDVDQLVAMYVAADIALGVGILTAGAALLVYFLHPGPSEKSAHDRFEVRF